MKIFRSYLSKVLKKFPQIIIGLGASSCIIKTIIHTNCQSLKMEQTFSTIPRQNRFDQVQSFDIIADIVETTVPSVVSIRSSKGLATGFIVDESGYVITNAHVIDKDDVFVKLSNGKISLSKVFAVDESLDLALIKINLVDEKFQALEFAEITEIRPGEFVIAFSSQPTGTRLISVGVVSAVRRDLEHSKGLKYLQTDAMIKDGNPGGPLVNLKGKVIGVNSLMISDGIGLAIPSNYCNNFISLAISNKERESI